MRCPTCQRSTCAPTASITPAFLTLRDNVPGADNATFEHLAAKAKANCRVATRFKAEITLDPQGMGSCDFGLLAARRSIE
jgi:organic hydroperoxide reductase OsmC/OhrA